MSATTDYPLFPLSQPLFPQQVIPLKIFEQRYLDLISRCLKEGSTFGVVQIREGREVGNVPLIFQVGVEARIVDWSQMPNGLLGIQIRGERKFSVTGTRIGERNLTLAEVEWLPDEPELPIPPHFDGLVELQKQLTQHPVVQAMNLPQLTDSRTLGWQLSMLLPMSMPERVNLLSLSDPLLRLEKLAVIVEQLGEGE